MRRVLSLLLVFLAVLAALAWAGSLGIGPMLITREGEQKMVLFFGNPVAVRTEPGAWWRLPLLTEVKVFDARYLPLNTPPAEVPTIGVAAAVALSSSPPSGRSAAPCRC